MMSKLLRLFMVLALAIPLVSSAQKTDREKLGYYKYLQPPASDALSGKEFYLLEIELDGSDAYRRQLAGQRFTVKGYHKADTDNPIDFTIRIREGAFSFRTPKKSSYSKEGKTFHYYKGEGRFHYTIKVFNAEDNEIFRDDVSGSKSLQGDNSESLTLANEYYNSQKVKFKEEVMLEQMDELGRIFENQFSNVEKTIHLNAVRIKPKKYDYPEFNEAFNNLNRVYEILKVTNTPTSESDELLSSVISVYTSFLEDATPEDKKSKKNAEVTAAAYYNLGIAQFLAQHYQKAKQAFTMAASYDDKVMYDVEYLIKTTQSMADRTGLKFFEP